MAWDKADEPLCTPATHESAFSKSDLEQSFVTAEQCLFKVSIKCGGQKGERTLPTPRLQERNADHAGDISNAPLQSFPGTFFKIADQQADVPVDRGLVTCNLLPTWSPLKNGNFFTLPDEIFYPNLGYGPITVYAYLLCCEDRRTHQCHPSYSTIADAAGLSVNTVMKYVTTLVDKQLITVEHTSYMDDKGMKWTGNNCYTILPAQQAIEAFYQQEMNCLEEDVERQRIAKLLRKSENNV